ncbi:MAG: hypothetical protein JNM24_09095 [Bdellovibrionaceae bacterium]|nr:hypothetical protein [Pseudobdellovibrionaceae bacterium]
MDYILAAAFIIFIMYTFDKVCLFLESKGWLNYSQTKKCSGRSIFSDLSDYIQPQVPCTADCKDNKAEINEEKTTPARYFIE